jgi:thioredoxin 2
MSASTVRCPNCGTVNRVRPVAQGVPQCASCHHKLPWIVDAGTGTFAEETTASVLVLVDFWAPWCGPCRMVSPAVEQVARDFAGRLKAVKVNVDDSPQVAGRFAVQGIPLLVLLRDGAEVDRQVGAVPAATLRAWVERHLGAPAAS